MNTLEYIAKIGYGIMQLSSEVIQAGINRRQCKKEAKLLREYFRSPDGLQTLIEFYILAQTAHYEPGGFLDPVTKQFDFLEAPKEHDTHLTALLNKNKKGIQELMTILEQDIKQKKSDSTKERIAEELLPLVKKYYLGTDNIGIVWSGLNTYFRSFIMHVPNKKGILVHVHPNPHSFFSKETGGYSAADDSFAMKRSVGLITYAHHLELSEMKPSLLISFTIRHSLHFSEELVDSINCHFPLNNTNPETSSWKRKTSYQNAIHLLAKSGYVLPFLVYDKTDKSINSLITFYCEEKYTASENVHRLWQCEL